MKNKKTKIIFFTMTALLLAGCTSNSAGKKTETNSSYSKVVATSEKKSTTESSTAASNYSSVDEAIAAKPTAVKSGDDSQKATADKSYDLADGSIKITAAGSYYITGSNSNAQIIVEAPEDAEVKIILNGVNLTSTSGPVILCSMADKVKITSVENSVNLVSDSSANTEEAAISAECDLTFNGDGTLVVTGSGNHGVQTKDDLKITNGTVYVSAVNDAFIGKDSVTFEGGTTVIEAGDKGVKSDQDNGDPEKSLITLAGGKSYVKADGEGMQATTFDILTGEFYITSGDDAINASVGSESTSTVTPNYKQSGGTVSFVSGGDGIDSNGSIDISGGSIVAIENSSSDNEPIDSDSISQITNLTLIAGGSNNAFPETESQSYVLVGAVTQGDKIIIDGVGEFTAPATISNMIISTPQIQSGSDYQVTVASNSAVSITAGQGATQGMGGGPGGMGGGNFGPRN
ncbi:MAG: carbohydrate-binding domain-containing protein [Streptococcaceae bacterium]|jgi:hypothetical protein|nr:carbohydrate-binding domain-containing protein [Streptococcaceae bacterium]